MSAHVERILDDAYDRGGWEEARRCALALHAAARSGVETTLAGLDALIREGIPYDDARNLVDEFRQAGASSQAA